MKNSRTKTHNLYKILFLLIVFLGVGYAFLEANLNINGDVTVTQPEFNIYVQSVSKTTGSTSGTPTIIGADKKEVDFTTALTSDGNSFFEETTTLVNKGSKSVYLLGIEVKVYDSNGDEVTLAAPYEYSLTKLDGTAIGIGKKVNTNETDSYKVKFNYINGTDMSTVTDYPTYTFKVVYTYGLEYNPVCATNKDITTLATNTCSANENITASSGIVCKRAIKLHEEECTRTNNHCVGAGYTTGSTITYGNCGTQNSSPVSGDAFTCDINNDGEFNELTERFYYVSDYYDTSTKTFDNTTAVLIYYNSVYGGISCNSNNYYYEANGHNYEGPVNAIEQLPTTTQWNVNLKNTSRAILGEFKTTHNSPTAYGMTLPTNFSYEGYAARLLSVQELMSGCGLTQVGDKTIGELDSCEYMMENTSYSSVTISSYGSWLENPDSSYSYYIWIIQGENRYIFSYNSGNSGSIGVRPVIEVPKTSIDY